jgi:hypothetical protein
MKARKIAAIGLIVVLVAGALAAVVGVPPPSATALKLRSDTASTPPRRS